MMARERTVCSVIAAGTISIASMAITIHPPCHEPGERRGLRADIGPILLWPQILLHDLFHHLFRHSARKDSMGATRAERKPHPTAAEWRPPHRPAQKDRMRSPETGMSASVAPRRPRPQTRLHTRTEPASR